MHTTDIVFRVVAALSSFGFDVEKLRFEKIARCVRVELPEGPVMGERFTAACAAVACAGLCFDAYARDRALVAFSPVLAS